MNKPLIVCAECGDDTTMMNDYPHHRKGCPRIGEKYAREEDASALAARIRSLLEVALAVRQYCSYEAADDATTCAPGSMLGAVIGLLAKANLVEHLPGHDWRMVGFPFTLLDSVPDQAPDPAGPPALPDPSKTEDDLEEAVRLLRQVQAALRAFDFDAGPLLRKIDSFLDKP